MTIEIPCDIGSIVYCTRPVVYNHETHNGVKRGKVVGIEINETKRGFVWVRFDFQPKGSAMAVGFKEFGVTAFISKYDAWNPLEQEGNRWNAD